MNGEIFLGTKKINMGNVNDNEERQGDRDGKESGTVEKTELKQGKGQ